MGCALLLFVSCVLSCGSKGDDSGNGSPTEEKKIQFSASQAGDGGEVEDYIASLLNKEFRVWSKKYRSNLGVDVFEGDRASYENSKWNYGDSKYWDLEMDYYRFCAYSDRGANLVGSSSASFEFFETQNVIDTGSFSKMYVAEDTVYKEKFCSVAKLDFKNMCSWIRFKFVNELSGNAKVKVIGFATNSDRNLKLVSDNVDGFVGSAKVRYVYGKGKPTYGDEGIVKKGNL
ncbi:MAG TPA: hypothetical protein DDY68_03940, partial [Porphyromonadaceae bacterium]|nr:hypothetical protein [Porphyromonadaceae bacterium]